MILRLANTTHSSQEDNLQAGSLYATCTTLNNQQTSIHQTPTSSSTNVSTSSIRLKHTKLWRNPIQHPNHSMKRLPNLTSLFQKVSLTHPHLHSTPCFNEKTPLLLQGRSKSLQTNICMSAPHSSSMCVTLTLTARTSCQTAFTSHTISLINTSSMSDCSSPYSIIQLSSYIVMKGMSPSLFFSHSYSYLCSSSPSHLLLRRLRRSPDAASRLQSGMTPSSAYKVQYLQGGISNYITHFTPYNNLNHPSFYSYVCHLPSLFFYLAFSLTFLISSLKNRSQQFRPEVFLPLKRTVENS